MRKKLRVYRIITRALYVLTFAFLILSLSEKVQADGDTVWQRDYDYTLHPENGTIILSAYKGSATDIKIPAEAIIDGQSYSTHIASHVQGGIHTGVYLFPWGVAERISFEQGVIADEARGLFSHYTDDTLTQPSETPVSDTIQEVDITGLDLGDCTNLEYMFYSPGITSITIGDLDTSKVTSMAGMFYCCSKLEELDLSSFDLEMVQNATSMFHKCESLTKITWNLSTAKNLTNISWMFADCKSLEIIDLSDLPANECTDKKVSPFLSMTGAFSGCENLRVLDLSFVAPFMWDALYLAEDSALEVIYPPLSVKEDVSLDLVIYDAKGESYEALPKGLDVRTPFYTKNGLQNVELRVQSFVARMYTEALGRNAEEEGLQDWTQKLMAQETDGAGIAHGFIESDEFHNRNLTDEAYVTVLYHTFFDREPDEAGYRDWMDSLSAGYSRRYVLRGFVNSDEFGNLCDSFGIIRGTYTITEDEEIPHPVIHREKVQAFVTRLYEKCLNREGEPAGIEDWTERIMSGEWEAGDVARIGFFFSEEYQNRARTDEEYVTDMYHAFFDREPDEAGYADWTGQLADGADRLSVIYGFTDSEEFYHLLESYGLR